MNIVRREKRLKLLRKSPLLTVAWVVYHCWELFGYNIFHSPRLVSRLTGSSLDVNIHCHVYQDHLSSKHNWCKLVRQWHLSCSRLWQNRWFKLISSDHDLFFSLMLLWGITEFSLIDILELNHRVFAVSMRSCSYFGILFFWIQYTEFTICIMKLNNNITCF